MPRVGDATVAAPAPPGTGAALDFTHGRLTGGIAFHPRVGGQMPGVLAQPAARGSPVLYLPKRKRKANRIRPITVAKTTHAAGVISPLVRVQLIWSQIESIAITSDPLSDYWCSISGLLHLMLLSNRVLAKVDTRSSRGYGKRVFSSPEHKWELNGGRC